MLISPYVLITETLFSGSFTPLCIWIPSTFSKHFAVGNESILQSIAILFNILWILKSRFTENVGMLEVTLDMTINIVNFSTWKTA